jgi:hypothetical protein
MSETTAAAFLELVAGRDGHFRVEAVARDDYDLWLPADCPLCAAGLPLEDVAGQIRE